jgi:hypothetical protein
MWWSKKAQPSGPSTLEQVLDELASMRRAIEALTNTVNSSIKRYKCVICNSEFARLPNQSEKRCSHCQAQIKEIAGLTNGNAAHRPAGHNTRGPHKKFGDLP